MSGGCQMRGIRFIFGSIYALALFACSPSGGQDPLLDGVEVVGNPDRLTSAEWSAYIADLQYIYKLTKTGVPVQINFADPRQYNLVMARLKLGDKTAENSP